MCSLARKGHGNAINVTNGLYRRFDFLYANSSFSSNLHVALT